MKDSREPGMSHRIHRERLRSPGIRSESCIGCLAKPRSLPDSPSGERARAPAPWCVGTLAEPHYFVEFSFGTLSLEPSDHGPRDGLGPAALDQLGDFLLRADQIHHFTPLPSRYHY